MDMIFNLLAATTLMTGAPDTTAFEAQASNAVRSPATTTQVSRDFGGAYASTRGSGDQIRNNTVVVPSQNDFQLGGR
jgi:hypothetical protein